MMELLIIFGTLAGAVTCLVTNRYTLLVASMLWSSSFAIYWFNSAETGASIMFLTAFAIALIQFIAPKKTLQKTFKLRLGLAIVMALTVCIFNFNGVADIIILLAFITGRSAESFRRASDIQLGYLVSVSLWVLHAFALGDMNMVLSNLVFFSLLAFSVIKGRYKSKGALAIINNQKSA